MQTSLWRRCLSFLLVIVMVVGLMPGQVFAAESDPHDHTHQEDTQTTGPATEGVTDDNPTPATTPATESTPGAESAPTTEWTEDMLGLQKEINDFLNYWLVYYGFQIPEDQAKFSDALMAEFDEEVVISDEQAAAWEDLSEQIENVVVNVMPAGERDAALGELKILEYEILNSELTENELEALLLANPVFWLFGDALYANGTGAVALASGSFTVANGKITMAYNGGSTADTGTKNGETGATFAAWASGGWRGSTNTITITNSGDNNAVIEFSYSISGDCSACSLGKTSGSGSYTSAELAPDASFTVTLTGQGGLFGGDEPQLVMTDITWKEAVQNPELTIVFDNKLGGVTVGGETVTSGVATTLTAGVAVELVATPNGSTFLGWVDETGAIKSTSANYLITPSANMTLKAAFASAATEAWFRVGNMSHEQSNGIMGIGGYDRYEFDGGTHLFQGLDDAVNFAAANSKNGIVLASDGTLLAGDYTIPNGIMLLIPYNSNQWLHIGQPAFSNDSLAPSTAYRTLHMATGANLTIASGGTVNVNAAVYAANGSMPGSGAPMSTYGYVKMAGNSNITVQSGGRLSVFGYIGGTGTVTAKSGATLYEMFQFEDFRGGGKTTDMAGTEEKKYGVFPMNSYTVQNILVPMTLEAGATEYAFACMTMSGMAAGTSIKFISNANAMFNLDSGSVTKAYDYAKDRLTITANSGVMQIRNINMSISNVSLNSSDYDLPINGNMTIHIKTGSRIQVYQDVALLPGSEFYVDAGAFCELMDGYNLFIYDMDQWPTETGKAYVDDGNWPMRATYFVPERQYTRTVADLKDVYFKIAGEMYAGGNVYVTGNLASEGVAASGGAAITGVEGGMVKVKGLGTPAATGHHQMVQAASQEYIPIALTDVRLQNGDGSYTNPLKEINSTAGTTYTYTNGKWVPRCNGDAHVSTQDASTITCKNPKVCDYCGAVMEQPDHTPNIENPTCTAAQICTVCTTEIKPALGHTTFTSKPAVSDSCKEGVTGYKEAFTCNGCGLYFAAQNAATMIGDGSQAAYEAWKADPDGGLLDDAAHTPGEATKENIVKPSCTADGGYDSVVKCGACGEELSRNYVADPMTGHAWSDWTVTKESTCKVPGTEQRVCANCGGTETQTSKLKDHTPGDPATCTTPQTCTVCGDIITAALGHTPGEAVKDNIIDDEHYELVTSCSVCGVELSRVTVAPGLSNDHTLVTVQGKDPTCTEAGYTTYHQCTNPDCAVDGCGGTYKSGYEELPALGHTAYRAAAQDITYQWNDDHTECTASTTCTREGCNVTVSETVTQAEGKIKAETVEPTCEAAGYTTYTATFAAEGFSTDKITVDIAQLNHNWGAVVYTFYKGEAVCDSIIGADKCVATQTCSHNTTDSCIRTEEALVKPETVAPTCTEDGTVTYSVSFKEAWHDAAGKTQTGITAGEPATGHTWTVAGMPTWTDTTSCEVALNCSCGATQTATTTNITSATTQEATCVAAGNVRYTATFDAALNIAPQTKDVPTSALGHSYGDVAGKDATCTEAGYLAAYQCGRCDLYFSSSAGNGTLIGTGSQADYDAWIAENGAGYIAPEGHSYTDVAGKTASCTAAGYLAAYKCDTCKLYFSDKTGNGVLIGDGSQADYDAWIAENGDGYLEPLAHTPGAVQAENIVNPSCTVDGSHDDVVYCTVCTGEISRTKVVDAKFGHTEETVPGYAASCNTPGLSDGKKCSVCGETLEAQEEISALSHAYKGTVTQEPTCEDKGVLHNVCERCGSENYQSIDELGHDYKAVVTDPTCTEQGYTTYTCTHDPSHTYTDNYVAATGHAWDEGSITTPATCVAEGVKTYTCGTCGDTKTEGVDALGHDHQAVVTDPTCTEQGYTTHTCSRCGDNYTTDEVNATGHAWDEGSITTPATCVAEGVKTYTCGTCGDTKTEGVDALGHAYGEGVVTAPTCTQEGYTTYTCARCTEGTEGHTKVTDKVAETGHKDENFDHICDNGCDAVQGECKDADEDHYCDYGFGHENGCDKYFGLHDDITTDNDHLCDYCGDVIGDGHVFENGKCNCGYWQDLTVHAVVVGTTGLQQVIVNNAPIKYGNNGAAYTLSFPIGKEYCTKMESIEVKVGGTALEAGEYAYDSDSNTLTIPADQITGNVEIVVTAETSHGMGTTRSEYKAPSCTEVGYVSVYSLCPYCQVEFLTSHVEIAKTPHSEYSIYTEATFDADAYTTYICAVCGESRVETHEGTRLKVVATIGQDKYETLEEAIAAAEAGDVIVLQTYVAVEGDQTWDLTGITLRIADGGADYYGLTVRGNLTIQGGKFVASGWYGIGVTANGKLTINDGQFEGNGTNDYLIGSYGTTEINGGTFKGIYNCVNGFDGTVIINGGTFTTDALDYTGEYESEDVLGNVEVKGGTYSKEAVKDYLADGYCAKSENGSYVVGEHKAGEEQIENNVDPDCTTDGSYDKVTYCTHCGEQISRETVTVDKLGHTIATVSGLEATCETAGYNEAYHCSVCQKYYSDADYTVEIADLEAWQTTGEGKIDKLGHDLKEQPGLTETCETDGYKAYYLCQRTGCGKYFEDAEAQTPIADLAIWKAEGGNGFISKLGHNYTSAVTKEATCLNTGVRTYTCQNDQSHTYTEVIPATGHDWETAYTWDGTVCTATATCNNGCGFTATEPANGVLTTTTAVTCETDGEGYYTATFTNELFEAQQKQVTLPKLGHKYTNYVSNGDATCTEDGTKTANCIHNCGKTDTVADVGSALGHNMTFHAAVEPGCETEGNYAYYECGSCGELFEDENGAVATNSEAVKRDPTGHTEETLDAVDPTCTATGLTEGTKCSVCGKTLVAQEIVAANGHDMGDWAQTLAPACETKGEESRDCANCDYCETQEIPATGHTEVDDAFKAPTCTETGLTAGSHCSVCDKILIAQTVLEAYGHNCAAVAGKTANCTEPGYLAAYQCRRCNLYFSDKTGNGVLIGDGSQAAYNAWIAERGEGYIAPKGHTEGAVTVENKVEPTCTAEGSYDNVVYCNVCGEELSRETISVLAKGHTEAIIPGVEPDCTNTGLTEGKKCSVCNEILVKQETVAKLGHTEVIDPAVDSTCTATGKTEGKHCSVCNAVIVPQAEIAVKSHVMTVIVSTTLATCEADGEQIIKCANCDHKETTVLPATGHTEMTIPAQAPTCTAVGYTSGVKCSVCGQVLEAPQEIPAEGHDYVSVVTAPTCTQEGYTTHTCSVCNHVVKDTYVKVLGHIEVIDQAKAPTCTATGLTEGKHCSVCNEVLVAQQELAMAAHTEAVDKAKAATCTETGLTEGKHCSVCNKVLVAQDVVPAKGHAEEALAAQAPTCIKTGLTEGSKCSVCGEILVAQEVVAALGHTWDDGRVTSLPNCVTDGVRTFTCATCNGTKTEAEPALGHDVVHHEAKKPTFTSPGWEAYETCKRCDNYNTMVIIPSLGEAEITSFDEFIENLVILEEIADTYVKKVSPGKDPLMLIIKYIRTGVDRYNSGSWNIMAGYEDTDFAKYVSDYEDAYNLALAEGEEMMKVTGLKNLHEFDLPNGDWSDIGHVFGSMDITYTNKTSEDHADVSGWAGDTVDLMSMVDQFGWESTNLEDMIEEINKKYFLKYREDFEEEPIEGTFSNTDVEGDLDAFYIMQQLYGTEYENGTLTEIFSSYMTPQLTSKDRASFFLANRLDGASLRSDVRDAVYNEYVANGVVATLEGTRPFQTSDITDLRKACCYVFADYLCRLAGDFVEIQENPYFSVFQTTSSVLAPGITQKINYATTADNKTMVYYLATADVTRSDVHVYANYNNNDPAAGWEMSRVIDQANVAQQKYGDPTSEHYIENYNVIASINGAGYDMSTGEPSGILVMNGVVYHPIAANGFFGILEDGSAMIGTMEQYLAMEKENPGCVKEAIATFGDLIYDGKIVASDATDRASRTAVGITASGKVVFMVLDGRQGDLSCGGNMKEIAQIMLEAGCVIAVNLDGGGSSTYVAREEGATELSVVSKPSDGISRSVSTSLMMVSTAPSSTAFDHAVIDSEYAYFTVGSSDKFEATAVSATGNVVEMPEGVQWAVSNPAIGTITEDGVFIAAANGTAEIQLKLDGVVVGSKKINVVIPDNVYFEKSAMNAIYGQELKLPVKAVYEGKAVAITENDVTLSLADAAAGTITGFVFVGDEACGLKKVKVNAALNADTSITASMELALYTKDEASFDFENATGGDRQLAWDREVSNATEDSANIYRAVELDKDMVTTYSFAIDMSQIEMPKQLADLTYMLPGADMADASAWNFLLQLAERVSVLTEVSPVLYFDENLELDYSEMTVANEYFELKDVVFNDEENSLTLVLKWKRQVKPIEPATANPMCIVTGIKLTPKDDAAWNSSNALTVTNKGSIGYDIYLRANALYSFSNKPENQEAYGLYPFQNVREDGVQENGGHFQSIYKEFEDSYTLINGAKDGWVIEGGGFAYYENGEKHTGIREVEGYYYDFGANGINIGQKKYSGDMTDEQGNEYYLVDGVKQTGWLVLDMKNVRYFNPETGIREDLTADEVPSTCIIDGQCLYTSESGAQKLIQYDDAAGHEYVQQPNGAYVCSVCGWERIEMPEAIVTLSNTIYTYNGAARTPATTATAKDGRPLTKPGQTDYPDYYSTYRNNVDVGTATVTLTASKYGVFVNKTEWRGNAAESITIPYEIRPDLPKNPVVTSNGGDLVITWSAALAPDVTYVIYTSADGDTWKEVGTTTGLSFEVTKDQTIGQIQIGTRKVVDGKAYESVNRVNVLKDVVVVVADNNDDGKPTLTWNAVKNAASYEVYRATKENGTFTKMFTTKGRTYTNSSAVGGGTYYYYVKAILNDGTERISAVERCTCTSELNFKVTASNNANGKPSLKWNAVPGAASYEVYRADSAYGEFAKTFTTKGTTYTNTGAIAGNLYYYQVKICMTDGIEILSDPVPVLCLGNNTVYNVVTGSYKSFGDAAEVVTIQLFAEGATEAAYEFTNANAPANEGTWKIEGVARGTYTVRVMKKNHVLREYTLVVDKNVVYQDVEIWLLGDVTGDGLVNFADYSKVLSRSKNPNSDILVGYAFECGDVNNDGVINFSDYSKVLSQAKGKHSLW